MLSRDRGNAPGLFFGNVTGVGNAEVQTASTVLLDRDVVGFGTVGAKAVTNRTHRLIRRLHRYRLQIVAVSGR